MISDDDWEDDSDEAPGVPPVRAICYFDSLAELQGYIAELWDELAASAGGVELVIDAALECSLSFYAIADGAPDPEDAVGADAALLQLGDDGLGPVSPAQLWGFFEALLEDVLPWLERDNRAEVFERFAGGERSLIVVDTSGLPLAMPGSGDW